MSRSCSFAKSAFDRTPARVRTRTIPYRPQDITISRIMYPLALHGDKVASAFFPRTPQYESMPLVLKRTGDWGASPLPVELYEAPQPIAQSPKSEESVSGIKHCAKHNRCRGSETRARSIAASDQLACTRSLSH